MAARVALLERLPHPGHRPAAPNAGHEHVNPAVERVPQLGTGRAAVDLRVGRVGELVGQEHVIAGRQRAGGIDRLGHPAQRLGDPDLGPVEPQQPLALAAHPLRQREDQVVAAGGADERQRDPGVAARGLDDRRAAGLDPPLALGRVDHRDPDPVLDAAAGVERLELGEQLHLETVRNPGELDHRGPADKLGDVVRWRAHRPNPSEQGPGVPGSAGAPLGCATSRVRAGTAGGLFRRPLRHRNTVTAQHPLHDVRHPVGRMAVPSGRDLMRGGCLRQSGQDSGDLRRVEAE